MSVLIKINNDFESYQRLTSFYNENKNKSFDVIPVELHGWFSANMAASLGAVCDKLAYDVNEIIFTHIDDPVKTILQKNNFLSFFGYPRVYDDYHSTIQYLKFGPNDGKFFNSYVTHELLARPELPPMPLTLKAKIIETIYEIFVNAQMHSETSFIYTCGQFFPKKNTIEFTIADTGIGFKEKINRRFNANLSAIQAIKWAVQDRNTTKKDVTGGIGLAILKEVISHNKGQMQIISGDGFYSFNQHGEHLHTMNAQFPGTAVTLQFCTDDITSYVLPGEADINNIF